MIPSGRLRVALLCFLGAVMVSCADMKHWRESRTPEAPPPPVEDTPPPPPPVTEVARGHMQAGEYQRAIDVYHAGYEKTSGDQKLLSAYVQALESMAATANQALDQQAMGAAGKTYDILLKNYARFSGFEEKLTFTRASLNEKLNHCKKTLFKQGFEEYRKGNLSQSIALWEDLLVIDPQNADIKEALRIAKLQQKNLHETE